PHRRNSNVAFTDLRAARMLENFERANDFVIVIKRLSHPHQNDIGDRERSGNTQKLVYNFPTLQVSSEFLVASSAKSTGHLATHLGGNAKSVTIFGRDKNGLDLFSIQELH